MAERRPRASRPGKEHPVRQQAVAVSLSSNPSPQKRPKSARLRGRQIAHAVFYSVMFLFTGTLSVQISAQAFSPLLCTPTLDALAVCQTGLRELARSMEAARAAADEFHVGPEDALGYFRATLASSPAWQRHRFLACSCADAGPAYSKAFEVFQRLRYAEEDAVRKQARELTPLRHQAQALLVEHNP